MEQGYSYWARRAWIAAVIPSIVLFGTLVRQKYDRWFEAGVELLVFVAITTHWLSTIRRSGNRFLLTYIMVPLPVGALLGTTEALAFGSPSLAWSVVYGAFAGFYLSTASLIFRKMVPLPARPEGSAEPKTHGVLMLAEAAYWILALTTPILLLLALAGFIEPFKMPVPHRHHPLM